MAVALALARVRVGAVVRTRAGLVRLQEEVEVVRARRVVGRVRLVIRAVSWGGSVMLSLGGEEARRALA